MYSVLFAFLVLAILGGALSIGLFFANKKFSIEKDEKLVQLEEIMSGANCGGCGFAGCADYANAVFCKNSVVGLCLPGGQALADKMASILGESAGVVEKKVAYVFCATGCNDSIKSYDYNGLMDCNAAAMLFNGDNACNYGCLHLLSCQKVCDHEAISVNEVGSVEVDKDKCVGCGKCVSVCPHNVIKLIPYTQSFAVKCNSHDKGAVVNKACSSGCIGCKICEVKFPESGIKVVDNLAVVENCDNNEVISSASEACPKKIIRKI